MAESKISKCSKLMAEQGLIAMNCNHNINQEYGRFGFDDYIPKPFDLDLLYLMLRKSYLNSLRKS
jgi:CheY-like chemotaxis protein